jgi:predicted aspartyl protease
MLTHEMGTFRTDVELENPAAPGARFAVRDALVDTGAALSWFPGQVIRSLDARPLKIWHFRQANGTVLARWTAEVRVHAGGTSTIDEVVIGEPGDLVLLGARSLEGLNLRVDPVSMRLVDAGPAPAACAG